jgi:excisionase family DNA binding protein
MNANRLEIDLIKQTLGDGDPGLRQLGPDSELLTIGEVSALLKVPKSWVYERTRRRGVERFPHIKLGKYLRFEESEIRRYLSRNREGG